MGGKRRNLEEIKPLSEKQELMKREQIEGQSFIQVVSAAINWHAEWAPKSLTSLILQFRKLSTEKGECH